MTLKKFNELFPNLGRKIKVTNHDYIDGGYVGTIIGCSCEEFIESKRILLKHPLGGDCWEPIENCEII